MRLTRTRVIAMEVTDMGFVEGLIGCGDVRDVESRMFPIFLA